MVSRKSISAKEFEKLADSLGSCELVRGEIVTMSPGAYPHSSVSARVTQALSNWADDTRAGRVLSNETGVITETKPDTVRGVDVAYYSYARLPKGREPRGFMAVPPTLAVEVVGTGKTWKSLTGKAGEYLAMGADRVWVIDPATRCMHVFSPEGEPRRLSWRHVIRDDEILPGFSCRVSAFFR